MAPAAGGRSTTTARVCILFACCHGVLFAQLASTQALNPHVIDTIGARHAVENWGREIPPGTATRFGLKRLAQGHEQYCSQAPKIVMGITGPQAIKFTGDLCLNMVNTTGKPSKIIVEDVCYDLSLQYNLVRHFLTDISRTGHVTTFSTENNLVFGPARAFQLVQTCGVYALPVNSEMALAAFRAAKMTKEELMHLRINHCVSYVKM